jgi:hypothetical protein
MLACDDSLRYEIDLYPYNFRGGSIRRNVRLALGQQRWVDGSDIGHCIGWNDLGELYGNGRRRQRKSNSNDYRNS